MSGSGSSPNFAVACRSIKNRSLGEMLAERQRLEMHRTGNVATFKDRASGGLAQPW